jgi:hydroxymethylbilane synthase
MLQAELVRRALLARWPFLEVIPVTRSSEGDRDRRIEIWASADKGLFTADLSQALVDGHADAVVHSWKDLPIAGHPATVVVATMERADPRDVLLVRRDVVERRPAELAALSSSPRRGWQLRGSAPRLLPWPVADVQVVPIRGNVPTRLNKLLAGEGDALMVAKAALDRLLSADAPPDTAGAVRKAVDQCRWMVLPVKEHPTAPAQGALAVEIAQNRLALREYFEAINHAASWRAVEHERRVLEAFGGGCQEAVGVTVLVRDYGQVTSVRARVHEREMSTWSLSPVPGVPPAAPDRIWPRLDERARARRMPLDVSPLAADVGLWVSRAEALPPRWPVSPDQPVWAAGSRTWERLAARGIWVNGCADGLGDGEAPDVDALAGRPVHWRRLTHVAAGDPDGLATYAVDHHLPGDLGSRTHFYWTSGSAFLEALAAHPSLRGGWHASGPGRTARVIRGTLDPARVSVWLDYDQWHHHVTS